MGRAVDLEDDVVVERAVDLDRADPRPGPADAVGRLGDAGHLILAVSDGLGLAAVVEQPPLAILEHRAIAAEGALPRPIESQHHPLVARLVQHQPHAGELLDQVAVDEKLAPIAHLDRRPGTEPAATHITSTGHHNTIDRFIVNAPEDRSDGFFSQGIIPALLAPCKTAPGSSGPRLSYVEHD